MYPRIVIPTEMDIWQVTSLQGEEGLSVVNVEEKMPNVDRPFSPSLHSSEVVELLYKEDFFLGLRFHFMWKTEPSRCLLQLLFLIQTPSEYIY